MLSRILYVYSHPVNIQRLRFPPIAAFITFGGKRWGSTPPLYTQYYVTLCFRIGSAVGVCLYDVSFQVWITSSRIIFQTWKRVWTHFPCWQLAFGTPPPKWPEHSGKLRSLNNSWGWHKTIFSTESCSRPTKTNESQQKKCHGVKTYAHFFSYRQ